MSVSEAYQSRSFTEGIDRIAEVKHKVFDVTTAVAARLSLIAATDPTFDWNGDGSLMLPRSEINAQELSEGIWDATVVYRTETEKPVQQAGEVEIEFDTTGETTRIYRSLPLDKNGWRVGRYPNNDDNLGSDITIDDASLPEAPNNYGLIGLKDGEALGVDVGVGAFAWSETHILSADVCTVEYRRMLAKMSWTVHDDISDDGEAEKFRGYYQGEVLFMGAVGRRRASGEWEVTFRFAYSENSLSNFVVGGDGTGSYEGGGITVPFKGGWEHMDIVTEKRPFTARVKDESSGEIVETETPTAIVPYTVAVYIYKVYPSSNFADLLIGTE